MNGFEHFRLLHPGWRDVVEVALVSYVIYRALLAGKALVDTNVRNSAVIEKAMIDLLYGKWEALSKEREEIQSAAVES